MSIGVTCVELFPKLASRFDALVNRNVSPTDGTVRDRNPDLGTCRISAHSRRSQPNDHRLNDGRLSQSTHGYPPSHTECGLVARLAAATVRSWQCRTQPICAIC